MLFCCLYWRHTERQTLKMKQDWTNLKTASSVLANFMTFMYKGLLHDCKFTQLLLINLHVRLERKSPFLQDDKWYLLLKCYYNKKTLFSFSLDSDFIFGKSSSCQLLWLNFKTKSNVLTTIFNYDFSFKHGPPLLDSVPVELH